jgi:hypothetical protein
VEQAEWDNLYRRPVSAGVRAEQSPSQRPGVVDFGEFHCGERL